MSHRLRNLVAGLITGGVTVLITASILYALLRRLGDDLGVVWTGRIVLVATVMTVVALAVAYLGDRTSNETPSSEFRAEPPA